jgi:hypothetical protein
MIGIKGTSHKELCTLWLYVAQLFLEKVSEIQNIEGKGKEIPLQA